MRIRQDKTMNRLNLILLVFPFLLLAPCTMGGAQYRKMEILNRTSPDTFIVMQRGACERRCAAYRIIIFDDGTLIWDGQSYVRRLGVTSSTVDTIALKHLIDEIQAMDYFSFKNEYLAPEPGCATAITDEPISLLSVSARGKAKTIIHDHSCRGPIPDKLTALEDKIDKLAHSARWRY